MRDTHFKQMKDHRSNVLNLSSYEKQAWKKKSHCKYYFTSFTSYTLQNTPHPPFNVVLNAVKDFKKQTTTLIGDRESWMSGEGWDNAVLQ